MTTSTKTVSVSVSVESVKEIAGRDARLVYLVNAGLTIPAARAYLKENKDSLKASSTQRSSYVSDFYSLLESGPMSDEAFESWVSATAESTRKEGTEGQTNVERHRTHYNAIRIMANAIHAKS